MLSFWVLPREETTTKALQADAPVSKNAYVQKSLRCMSTRPQRLQNGTKCRTMQSLRIIQSPAVSIHSFVRSFIHSLTHSLIHSSNIIPSKSFDSSIRFSEIQRSSSQSFRHLLLEAKQCCSLACFLRSIPFTSVLVSFSSFRCASPSCVGQAGPDNAKPAFPTGSLSL